MDLVNTLIKISAITAIVDLKNTIFLRGTPLISALKTNYILVITQKKYLKHSLEIPCH